jgi:hypothetical protein
MRKRHSKKERSECHLSLWFYSDLDLEATEHFSFGRYQGIEVTRGTELVFILFYAGTLRHSSRLLLNFDWRTREFI